MKLFLEIFRIIGATSGLPFNWLFFKRKTYYEDKSVQGKRIKGGKLIVANHYGPLDYVANCFTVYPRKLFVVMGEDGFRNPFRKYGMEFFGGIRADRRNMNMHFVAESVRTLRKDKLVLIFPEGHNTDDGTVKAFYPSYILIALRAKKPIVPIVSDGNYGFFKRLHLIIGKPIDLYDYLPTGKHTKEDIPVLNEIVRNKVLELREELDRRINKQKGKTQ